MHGPDLLAKGMTWRVGKEDHVMFWKDNWFCDRPLMHQVGVIQIRDIDCTISRFFRDGW